MARVKTFADGGTLTPADVNLIRSDADASLGWRRLIGRGCAVNFLVGDVTGSMAGKLWEICGDRMRPLTIDAEIKNNGTADGFVLNAADYAGQLMRCRLKVALWVNSIPITGDGLYFALWPVTYIGGSFQQFRVTPQPMGGSTGYLEQTASQLSLAESGEFPMPTEGSYIFGITSNATAPTNHKAFFNVDLEVRPESIG